MTRRVKYPIGAGSTVTLHFSLTLEDGTVADSTFDGEPHTFILGDGSLLRGLELALYGLRPGDTQRLLLHPEQTFGMRDPAKIHHLPRAEFADDITLEPGIIIGFTDAGGEEIPGTVCPRPKRPSRWTSITRWQAMPSPSMWKSSTWSRRISMTPIDVHRKDAKDAEKNFV